MTLKYFYQRFIYDNLFRPTRLKLYDAVIREFVEAGYKFYTLYELNLMILDGRFDAMRSENKICIIRHDVDTDPKTATQLAKIESKYGIVSTYYYRLRTARLKEMKFVAELGNEVSYHYEEIGTYSKKHKLKNKLQVDAAMNDIQQLFERNLTEFRRKTSFPCSTIASHGDWCNAKYLGIPNYYLLNEDLRENMGIQLEAYDECFMKYVTFRISDLGGVNIWHPINYKEAIKNNERFVYILIHPRQWYTRIYENLKEDFHRVIETIRYKF